MEAPELVALLAGRRVAVVTGAGMSTDSGIPDYRGPDSPPSNPMTIRQFTSDPVFRQRYWARNHVGWRHMDETLPNAGHRSLAALEHAGVVTGVITQNVDLLHTKAGSRAVVNLHGTYAQVVCLSCGFTMSRAELAVELEALNPGFVERAEQVGGIAVAPDADAMVEETSTFRYLDCPRCGGMLKPDIVYFGENVAKEVVEQAYSIVDDADALLVAGSS
ncbi:MAG: Sir2 family NAD-dependent protein deacetylase, partial [Mycobacterium sp.]